MKADPRSKRRHAIAALIALAALMASCDNILETIPRKDTGGGTGGGGTLTAVARLAGSSARHALPSLPALAYGALLYHDESSQGDFSSGIVSADGASVAFAFQTPSERSGLTLEVFAFADGTERADFSREGALLCGKKGDVEIKDDKITAEVALLPNKDASAKGTVSLKVKVPPDCALEIEDTANFAFTDDSPDAERTYTVTQKDAGGITGGAYALTFTVKKGGGVVHVFSEHINVFPGMVTDTWSGLSQGEAREVTQAMLSTTVYVRGAGGWYDGSADFKDTAAASDDNPGSLMRPFATIQKAVDAIIARNDRSSAYTILVDGTLTYDGSNTNGMADFSALDKNLNLTIKPLSSTGKATLDANQKSRVIYAYPNVTSGAPLTLTLENLVITGGNTAANASGGGIYIRNGTCIVTNCEISGNTASNNGGGVCVGDNGRRLSFTMNGGKISGNISTTGCGGGIYSSYGNVIMNDGEISDNTAGDDFYGGGGVFVNQGKFEMKGGKIIHNTAKSGGGVNCQDSTFIMSGAAEISDNTASNGNGGGVAGYFSFKMRDEAKITNNKALNGSGGGVYNTMGCTITGGEISGNEAKKGGGVYLAARGSSNPKTTMTGGTVSGNTATDAGGGVYVSIAAGKSNTLTIGGTAEVSGNTTTGNGGGIYVENKCALNMNAGSISGNSATENGGGGIYNQGTLTVSGGSIENCTAATSGGGIYNNVTDASITCTLTDCTISGCKALGTESGQGGGGIYNNAGTLELTNCTITGGGDTGNPDARSGGGIYNKGTITVTGGTIKNCTSLYAGGGVYNDGTFTMTGGTIGGTTDAEKNTSKVSRGGGVFISSNGTFTMTDGTISRNVAATGGGVGISGTFTMIGGEISGNTVINSGGGVYIDGDGSTFTMKGGAISGNVCSSGGTGNGGGVYVVSGSFTMKGGTISGNEAKNGGGVYNSSTFTMESDAEISGNTATDRGGGMMSNGTFTMGGSASVPAGDDGKNDVYLASGKTIGIASALTSTTPIATITPNAYTEGTAVLSAADGSTTTLADECEKFAVTAESDGTEWIVAEDGTLKSSVPEGFVRVEGGTVTGGALTPASDVFVSGRTVTIRDMYVSDHEITQEEYETYCTYGSSSPSSTYGVGNSYPAYYVSWYDAIVYCNLRSLDEGLTPAYKMGTKTDPKDWSGILTSNGRYCGPSSTDTAWDAITYNESADGYRLPTEAEWEYIARGGKTPSGTTYSGSETADDVAWHVSNSGSQTHEVKQKAANALGIYDMSGNVQEWSWDWYSSTVTSGTPGTGSASGSKRVNRGATWGHSASFCTVSYRSEESPYARYNYVGFRVVRSVSQ